ncbi:MAG TPA: glycosyltransferase family 4 protein [Sedimentisphaerales bacterium]|jgi:UDP-glucose:(heptosyl)LPS alpha-1,3-glucosyltransferase|nr:glycosyltransferase family 4 protein [Sedimentisphaerales bacterium]HNU29617.1 glycosyltransferase family 4 protein [Sedimentisphaerales bacterium]
MEHRQNNTLAFCLFRYFPYGGQQRDMLRIALACQKRGHAIHIYTTRWVGDVPDGFTLHRHRPHRLTNHGRMREYHAWLTRELARQKIACVVGFNKMPGLDVYFAADGCYVQQARRKHTLFSRLTGRHRVYARFEEAVFAPDATTEILLIAEPQRAEFEDTYHTPPERMHLLPPWISADRTMPQDRQQTRRDVRGKFRLGEGDFLLLQVGSDFKRKAVDRTLQGLASLPQPLRARAKLAIAGLASSRRYRRLATTLGIVENVVFLGPRDDVTDLMIGSDLLLHPARSEPAGVVLIEAMFYGLPVLCSGACGHAGHIRRACGGRVLPEPFEQSQLNRALLEMLTAGELPSYGARARAYVDGIDVYAMPEHAGDLIEAVAARRLNRPAGQCL